MGQFSTPTHVGVAETFIVMGLIYLCFMMVGRRDRARPAAGLAAGGLCRAGPAKTAGHDPQRVCLRRAEDAAILADLVGAVPQCHRRHRRVSDRPRR